MKTSLRFGEYLGNTVRKAELGDLRLVQTAYSAGADLPGHSHENPYLCFVINGGYTEKSGGSSITCTAGDLIIHASEHSHSDKFDQTGGTCFNVEFKNSWLKRMGLDTGFLKSLKVNTPDFRFLSGSLFREFSVSDRFSDLMIESFIVQLAVELNRSQSFKKPGREKTAITKLKELLYENYSANPSLSFLSSRLNIHPVYCARMFKEQEGITIGEFLRRIRIEKACHKLINSCISISGVAIESGFFDQSHFTRTFKKYTGVSPLRFRDLFQKVN